MPIVVEAVDGGEAMTDGTESGPGAIIRARRLAAGLSQPQLARLAGVAPGTLRDLEQGRTRHPHPGLLERLAAALSDGTEPAPEPELWLRILGPLAAWRDGRPLALGPPQQRAVLGLLALRAGQAVPRTELVEGLWGAHPPGAAVNLVQAYVGRLRRILDAGRPPRAVDGRLVSTGRSYRLQLATDELDWSTFRDLTGRGARLAAAEPQEAADLYERALSMWLGNPLGGLPEVRTAAATAVLQRAWADAVVGYTRIALRCGRADRALPALWRLTEQDHLNEAVHALLIQALAGAGDPAAALGVYAGIRDRLADQLGIEPGAELAEARRRLTVPAALTGPPPVSTPLIPRQLPIARPGFIGRGAALKVLDRLVDRLDGVAAPGGTVIISAIGGAAGIGKTTLAVHWAHLVADRFPDGQLYADLRGFDPTTAPLNAAEVIRGFLDALAVPAERIPAGADAQVALYRSLLARRQTLIVLDNAHDSDQVRPLLPAGPGCVVVVTSRRQLIGLAAAEGAHLIMLDLFDPADARQMLITRLGQTRVAAEPDAVTELIELCAGLPLALSLAAGRLATRIGFQIETLVAHLRDIRQQLDVLSPGDATGDLRTLFACTYRQLSPAAARMFRLLGLHPGPDVSLPAAASLAGLEPAVTRRALAELTGTHLATELTPDRWGLHDLLRAYAAELATAEDSPADRAAALDRLATHYLSTMYAVDRLRYPQYRPVTSHSSVPGVTVVPCADADDGLAWCQAERPALTALLIHAADTDPDGYPGSLLADVWLYFHLWSHHHDVAAARRVAATAAGPETGAESSTCAEDDPARDSYRRVLERGLRRGAALARVYTLFGMAQLLARVGRPAPALTFAAIARDRCRDLDDPAGAALALNLIGRVQLALGHPALAADSGTQAFDLCRDLGDQAGEAFAAETLGLAARSVGDHAGAVAYGLRAAELFDRLAETDAEVDALVHLGHAYRAGGDEAAAARAWHRALTRLDDPLHPQAAVLRQLTMSDTADESPI